MLNIQQTSDEIALERMSPEKPKLYYFPKICTLDMSCPKYVKVNGCTTSLSHGGAVYCLEDNASKVFLWSNGSMYKLREDNPLGGYNSYEDLIESFD